MFTLVITGRPNVGKSTLFNRLAGRKLAIVSDTPGVTRDWREAETEIDDRPVRLIDTAGLEESFDDSMPGRMRRQTESALKEADAVLFLIDGRAGLTPLDTHFAVWLRKQGKPVILGINKCESEKAVEVCIAESYGLGLGEPLLLSAEHGVGIGDLYDTLESLFPPDAVIADETGEDERTAEDDLSSIDDLEGKEDHEPADSEENENKPLRIAIAGRPNSGKSTLLNTILGFERVMTGPEAGTTRDAIAVKWEYEGRPFRLVDTAGMRRRARIENALERLSVADTLRAIRLAEVVILVVDATLGVEKQDLTIAQHVEEEGRALVVAVNKWDAVTEREKTMRAIRDRLLASLSQLPDVPVVTLSALNGKNTGGLLDAVLKTYEIWNARVPTARLNRWLAAMESRHPAPMAGGRPNRIKYITQIKARPPTFALWASRPADLPDDYCRYIVNGLRKDFNLPGVPVRLLARASKNPYG